MLGDGICHDEANTKSCYHDFGDCCMPVIDASNCTECMCREDQSMHAANIDEFLLQLNSSEPFKEDWITGTEPFRLNYNYLYVCLKIVLL